MSLFYCYNNLRCLINGFVLQGALKLMFGFCILAAVLYCVHGIVSSIANKRCLHHWF